MPKEREHVGWTDEAQEEQQSKKRKHGWQGAEGDEHGHKNDEWVKLPTK